MRWLLSLLVFAGCGEDQPSPDAGPADSGLVDSGIEPSIHRVLFIVKNANSMAVADPERRRKTLVEDAVDKLTAPHFELGLSVYSDKFEEAPFTPDPETDGLFQARLTQLEDVENLGVLDGAVRRAADVLTASINAETDPGSRWSVVIMTDGFPTPTCTPAPDISPICESPRAMWMMFGVDPGDPANYYEFEGGGAYNRREDVIGQLELLAALSERIAVHAVLLYTEAIVGQPIEASLGLNRGESVAFVEQIAETGRGRSEVTDGVVALDWASFLAP